MNNIFSGKTYRASPERVSLEDETNNLASHLERFSLIHSSGYASAGDHTAWPACPINARSFLQYRAELMRYSIVLLSCLIVSACGKTGALYLPEDPPPPAVQDQPLQGTQQQDQEADDSESAD